MSVIQGNLADGKPMQSGGWYNGQQWNGSSLSAPGTTSDGKTVSNAVIAQTNPSNVDYIHQLQGNVNLGLPANSAGSNGGAASAGLNASVDAARNALTTSLTNAKAEADAKLATLQGQRTDILGKEQVLTQPFREDLQNAQNQALHVNDNFEANQKLTDELDSLLTQGNELIKQQQSVTGLASVRNPRVQQTINDVQARVGVIQAVMSARNSQISVAENMIDRSINAIQADRQDQIGYYDKVLQLNQSDILSLDKQSQDLAQQQRDLLKSDYTQAVDTANYVKKLLIDPATAQLMGDAGVTLNDSVEQINGKLQQATYVKEVAAMSNQVTGAGATAVVNPASVPKGQLITLTDSRGVAHYYQAPAKTTGSGSGTTKVTPQTIKSDFLTTASTIKSSGGVGQFPLLVAQYAPNMSLQDIYNTYSQSTLGKKYGKPTENAAEIKQVYDAYRTGKQPN